MLPIPNAHKPHQYRKRPVVITAQRFDPHKHPWPDGVKPWPDEHGLQPRDMSWGYIDTLEGRMSVQAGDYIITGIKGERYNCRADTSLRRHTSQREE